MKIIVTADIHNGYQGRLKDTIWSMEQISKYAVDNGISKVVVLGDLFHDRESITIDVLHGVSKFFNDKPKDQEWIVIPGNHDMFLRNSWEITSVGALRGLVTVYDRVCDFDIGDRKFVVVPFIEDEGKYRRVVKALESKYDDSCILLTHIGINNAVNNSCFLMKHWSVVDFSECKFSLILSGHYHLYQVVGSNVCYPGSPVSFRFDEGMVPHGFLVVDVINLSVDFVDIKSIDSDYYPPDFIVVEDYNLDSLSRSTISNNKIKVKLTREYTKDELDDLRDKLINDGVVSVNWQKDNQVITVNEDVKCSVGSDPVFERWLGSVDHSKYDFELLMKLHKEIETVAEDKFSRIADIDE